MIDTHFLYNTYLFTYSFYLTILIIGLKGKQIKFFTDFVALPKIKPQQREGWQNISGVTTSCWLKCAVTFDS